ncbi:Ankyrin repeat domain-containing protein 33B [Saguinus oedipus]|uniref:Ankyrin repeat domain-containing protein 33B n=1 Tax=Saguinus oedipus TaxID=9490 RepID=A0ABQ9WAB2_SAGOE|nr:Ankyrin repeat domain-containing protein 33B [Saguinus oedipus]
MQQREVGTSARAPRPALSARAPAVGMVLLAGTGPEGGGARCMTPPPPSPPRGAQIEEDPADYEEFEDFWSLPDTRSIASDDSFYPFEAEEEQGVENAESVPEGVPEAASLLRAACASDVGLLRALVRRGVSVEEAQETDRKGWSRRSSPTTC